MSSTGLTLTEPSGLSPVCLRAAASIWQALAKDCTLFDPEPWGERDQGQITVGHRPYRVHPAHLLILDAAIEQGVGMFCLLKTPDKLHVGALAEFVQFSLRCGIIRHFRAKTGPAKQ